MNITQYPAIIQAAFAKYNAYNCKVWHKAYFDTIGGGFNVYHREHNFSKKGGGGEAEKIVGIILAKYNGKQVEFFVRRRCKDTRCAV
jgi:hypothetical protein